MNQNEKLAREAERHGFPGPCAQESTEKKDFGCCMNTDGSGKLCPFPIYDELDDGSIVFVRWYSACPWFEEQEKTTDAVFIKSPPPSGKIKKKAGK